ncbi:MAG: protein-L-isoaspartate(D-aspartate) O-methyltransferase [Planctomycetota bacterium]
MSEDQQLPSDVERRPVTAKAILEAMRSLPREAFVPPGERGRASADAPLPIGYGQTISQPYIVILMTNLLKLTTEDKVLEIGTGSGFQAALLSRLTRHVCTVETIRPLAEQARRNLEEQGCLEVRCRHGDGYSGWPEEAPFDRIIVTCAASRLPPPLWKQLKPGGRIVVPIGGPCEIQSLMVYRKTLAGKQEAEGVTSVRFVPLVRTLLEEE